jgi:drug/metabolite transporter (DMT)-like permease
MLAVSLGLLSALCWSVHDCVARGFSDRLGPWRTAFFVALIGAVLLLPIVLWRGVLWQAEGWAVGYALALGVIYAVALGGLFKAFALAPVSIVAPMTAGYPALVVVWGLVNGLDPSIFEWLGLCAVLAGAVIVGVAGEDGSGRKAIAPGHLLFAIVAILAANGGFAAAVILGQTAAVSMGEIETTFVSRFPAALMLLPLFVMDQRRATHLPRGAVVAVIAMAALDVLAVTAINAAGHYDNKAFAAMAVSAYGALAVLIAMVVLKERVAKLQWLGIVLVVAGIALLGWPKG